MPIYTFKFGKYDGKSVEQVAVMDYSYLLWLQGKSEIYGKLSVQFKDRIDTVLRRLNDFVSQVRCGISGCDSGCENPAEYFGLLSTDDCYMFSPVNVSCAQQDCLGEMRDRGGTRGILPLPIKYDSLLTSVVLHGTPARTRKDIKKFLLECMGLPKGTRKTKKKLIELVDNLTLKSTRPRKIEQLSLSF